MDRPHHKHIARASSHFLCESLPDNWQEMSDDELDQFLTTYAWEPFEYWPTDDVWELIDSLALEIQNIVEGK